MPNIAKNNDVITVIVIFSVEPERQQELVDTIIDFVETTVKHQPGFVSASIHKSLDGVRVMNYAQWQTQEDYKSFVNNPKIQALGAKLAQFNLLDSNTYEVTISQPADFTPKISPGCIIHLGEFRLKPENQQRLIELERENVLVALQHPDFVSGNFHRSFDGTCTMNYGFWRSIDNFEALLKEPKYAPVREYWVGLAENEFHLYEVVFTEPAD